MATSYTPGQSTFGLLPEPETRPLAFLMSGGINVAIAVTAIIIGMTAKHVLQQHYEMTELIVPATPPPPMKIKTPPPQELPPPPEPPKVELQPRQIEMPKPKPEPKQIEMEAKVNLPVIQPKPQTVIMQPQPKAALAAAMPAQNNAVKASTAPVHLGETFGATPNPNATRPATVAAIGNPYGGMNGPAVAPHGVVGSTGLGNSTKYGSSAGNMGKVASAGIPGATGTGPANYGKVSSAGIPGMTQVAAAPRMNTQVVRSTEVEVLSKPPVRYTSEARQLRVQGDVVLSVTFLANGQVVVHGVIQGLGHGLDEEAKRVAEQIRFRPATNNGQPVDVTTKITITFQLA
ncbi:MAG TPA: TonB family protein [Terracidiphilus sp.]|nr:TonB family protein [Terracidiphilus sp.]